MLNVGKLQYSGLVSTHMRHSLVSTLARLRVLVAVLGDFEVLTGACERFLLAMIAGKIVQIDWRGS